jgi:hypothetical protein
LAISSFLLNSLIILSSVLLPTGTDQWPERYLTYYRWAGAGGIVWTFFLLLVYRSRRKKIGRLAEEILGSGSP